MAIIEFADHTPDMPQLASGGNHKNAIPYIKSYKKFARLEAYSDALGAYCRGAFASINSEGAISIYAGDATKLYRLNGMSFADVSSATYTGQGDDMWEFAQFNSKLIATNFADVMQIATIGSGSFAALSGTPPKARHIGIVREFVVVGNTNDSDGNVPYKVRWAGIGDETAWTISATTQADQQMLRGDDGWVQAIVGGEYGVIFKERSIYRMTYVGSPVVFQFDKLEDSRGLLCPRGWIKVGGLIFYISSDGFYVLAGSQSVPIGANRVDKTFIADLDETYLYRVTCCVLPQDKVVIFSYPGSGSTDGTPNRILMYNWESKKWCPAEFNHELVFRAISIGVTLDGLDSFFASLDSTTPSLDSKVWMGGALQAAAFDTDHKLSYFTGAALDATFETGETSVFDGQRADVQEVRALVDGGTHTVQMGTRETQAASVAWGSVATENGSGLCPVRSNSKYHRVRVNVTGEFTDAVGAEITKAQPAGER